jgi:hypothetical protein
MKVLFFLAVLLAGLSTAVCAQVNVVLLHQLIAESESEHGRQVDAKNKQALVSGNEEINRSEMAKLKATYRSLQSRFQTLGLAIDAAQIGLQATPIISEIAQQQSLVFRLAGEQPLLITLAYNAETDLAGQAYLLSNYLYGLLISIGDLNQMKAGDRKILFAHVLTELRRIAGASRGLAAAMQYANTRKSIGALDPFSGFTNTDKQLIDNIIRKASALKNH